MATYPHPADAGHGCMMYLEALHNRDLSEANRVHLERQYLACEDKWENKSTGEQVAIVTFAILGIVSLGVLIALEFDSTR